MISIHALLAESDKYHTADRVRAYISIHALLAESDTLTMAEDMILEISIHALLAESDLLVVLYRILRMLFLSTLSLRRATGS